MRATFFRWCASRTAASYRALRRRRMPPPGVLRLSGGNFDEFGLISSMYDRGRQWRFTLDYRYR